MVVYDEIEELSGNYWLVVQCPFEQGHNVKFGYIQREMNAQNWLEREAQEDRALIIVEKFWEKYGRTELLRRWLDQKNASKEKNLCQNNQIRTSNKDEVMVFPYWGNSEDSFAEFTYSLHLMAYYLTSKDCRAILYCARAEEIQGAQEFLHRRNMDLSRVSFRLNTDYERKVEAQQ